MPRASLPVRISVALTIAFGVGASTVPPAWALVSGALCALAFLAAFAFAEFPALTAGMAAMASEARRLAAPPTRGRHAAQPIRRFRLIPA